MLLSDLQTKDVVNLNNGNNLGRIIDANVDNNGKIIYFIAEERKMMRRVTRNSEITFSFESIKKIGTDVILVDI